MGSIKRVLWYHYPRTVSIWSRGHHTPYSLPEQIVLFATNRFNLSNSINLWIPCGTLDSICHFSFEIHSFSEGGVLPHSSCNFIQRFNTLMVAKAFILNKSHWRVSCLVSMDRSICINSFGFLYLSRHLISSCECCLRRSRSGTLIIWCGSFRLHNTVWNVICLPWSVFIRLRFVGDRLWGLGCLATAPLFLKVGKQFLFRQYVFWTFQAF